MSNVRRGNSTIVPILAKPLGVKQAWTSMPAGDRYGIIGGSCGGLAVIIILITWCCVKSARKGSREAAVAEADWKAQQEEAEFWRQKYRDEHFGNGSRLSTMQSTTKSVQGGRF
jgi:hypothetical protein